jgi:hypothetical protein
MLWMWLRDVRIKIFGPVPPLLFATAWQVNSLATAHMQQVQDTTAAMAVAGKG